MNPSLRRFLLSLPLLAVVALSATVLLLHLHRQAWLDHGEEALLWDWKEAVFNEHIPWAVVQYVAAAGALALARISWSFQWRPLRYILLAWGITWLPVALVATGDVTTSSAGPFNFPMSMFAVPLFGLFCLAEAGIILLIHAIHPSHSKDNPVAQQLCRKNVGNDSKATCEKNGTTLRHVV